MKGGAQNLRRGATPADGERLHQHRDEMRQLERSAREDPEGVLLDLHAELTVAVTQDVRRLRRRGKGQLSAADRKATIDEIRELRQLSDRVLEILRARGAAAQADGVFSGLEARLAQAGLGEGLEPILCPSCGGAR